MFQLNRELTNPLRLQTSMEGTAIFSLFSLAFIFVFFLLNTSRKRAKNLPPCPPSLPHPRPPSPHQGTGAPDPREHLPAAMAQSSPSPLGLSPWSSYPLHRQERRHLRQPAADRELEGAEPQLHELGVRPAPYGPLWRDLRRVATLEIFSASRLSSLLEIRLEEVRFLVKNLHKTVTAGGVSSVVMRPRLQGLAFNAIMRMVSGKRCLGADARNFREIISDVFGLSGPTDVDGFVPILQWVGFGRQQKRNLTKRRADMFLRGFIDEHRNGTEVRSNHTKTIIDLMLKLQSSEPGSYSDDIIMGMILVSR